MGTEGDNQYITDINCIVNRLKLPPLSCGTNKCLTTWLMKFGSEDAEKLRLHTVAEAGDMGSLEKMVDGSVSEDSGEGSE
ncbi:hypothetical protein HanHA300_Chr17g0643681 [Helianthus annuus]|nr:hypothetical protein HanHA300_Chr17g0643681 [Helianthus annuus]KAJ0635353.1 hypothetical protein HanOQP8_Chr17g0649871 [Helianthus annuus]